MNVICEPRLSKYNVLSHKICAVYLACHTTLLINSHQQFTEYIITVKTISCNNNHTISNICRYADSQLVKTNLNFGNVNFHKIFFFLKISLKYTFRKHFGPLCPHHARYPKLAGGSISSQTQVLNMIALMSPYLKEVGTTQLKTNHLLSL